MAPHWKGEAISLFPARCAEGPASRLGVVMGQSYRNVICILATSFLPRIALGHCREGVFLAGA